jgi:acyl phosphate:glycerol-3-phosphate acyltransferase
MNEDLITAVYWTATAYIFGAMPFSVWIGHIVLKTDIRQIGDGNPGATNVWRAGRPRWAVLAVLLDFLKGTIPVGIANFSGGLDGWGLTAVAIAPILGHATTPFLRFRGGKALASTLGVWCGLTLWMAPTVLGISFAIWLRLLKIDAWAVLLGMFTLLIALIITHQPPTHYFIWSGNLIILLWKHWKEIRKVE